MLSLNLARIRTPHERFDQVYGPEAFPAEGEAFTVTAPVVLGFDIYKDQDRFRLAGRVQTTLGLPCSRCLEPFAWPVDASFDLRYQPQAPVPAGEHAGRDDREVHDEDFSTAFYEDDTIDLGQLMREQFYLSLPMKPLCSDGCRGLCPQCGTNLNLGTCACTVAHDDPRFAALRALSGGDAPETGDATRSRKH
ncbi:MAG: DUF177 domain-containing protein [Vicinamibacterales bacterium]